MLATRELVDSFHQYAVEQLRNGGAALTVDELYEHWRAQMQREQTFREIHVGIDQIERGEGLTIDEAEKQIRQQLGLPVHQS